MKVSGSVASLVDYEMARQVPTVTRKANLQVMKYATTDHALNGWQETGAK